MLIPRCSLFLALGLMAVLLVHPSYAEDGADLILRHGRFRTVSEAGVVQGSLVVGGERILYLGADDGAEGWRAAGVEEIDLQGRTVTPGLIDAHSHLLSLGAALEQVDLVGTTSYEEVVERVRQAAAQVPAGTWIRGRGWDQNDWQVKEFPTEAALSLAVPDHPVWVRRIDGHAGLLNRRALATLEIDESIQDPSGGRILRDEDGMPSGVLIDAAMDLAAGKIPAPTEAQIERRIQEAIRHCLARGLTTVTEMGLDAPAITVYQKLRAQNRLALRVAIFLTDSEALLDEWFARGPKIDPLGRLQIRGVKLYADGALGSRGAALLEPYADDPQNIGLLITLGDRMLDISRRALASGFQVGIHAIGDRGALVALDSMDAALGGARPAARFRIEHAQVMRLQDLHRMAALGVIASMQPTHATSDMPWAEDRVGPRRIEGAYAWRQVLNAGGRLALGSDFPVESADPRLGLYSAVTRQDLEGRPNGGWRPQERLTPEEALRGFTLDAAYSLFLDDEVGSLEVGKRADLVVWAEDPMKVEAQHLPQVAVDFTLVGGKIVFRRTE